MRPSIISTWQAGALRESERAAKVAKDLQLGESVQWAEIEQALYFLPDAL